MCLTFTRFVLDGAVGKGHGRKDGAEVDLRGWKKGWRRIRKSDEINEGVRGGAWERSAVKECSDGAGGLFEII